MVFVAVVPEGGLPSLLPARPAFSLRSFPHPPAPLPGGKGETLGYFMQGAAPLASLRLNPRGTGEGANHAPGGGHNGFGRRSIFCFSRFSAPIPPTPFPAGRGGTKSLFCRGLRPRHPYIRPPAALIVPAKQAPSAEGSLCFGAKQTEPPFFGQCRQPRRGGTGGEELRRLRWSSPPGQGEQVPLGFILPPSPRVPQRQGQPATRRARPPPGAWFAPPCPSVASGSVPGMQGAKPLA